MARFKVIMTSGDERTEVATGIRTAVGAGHVLEGHVASQRAMFVDHSRAGERVVEGIDRPVDQEVQAAIVILLGIDFVAQVRFAVEAA